MIEIRCKACKRLALEVSKDTVGMIKTKCKRSACGKWIEIRLPLRTTAQISQQRA